MKKRKKFNPSSLVCFFLGHRWYVPWPLGAPIYVCLRCRKATRWETVNWRRK